MLINTMIRATCSIKVGVCPIISVHCYVGLRVSLNIPAFHSLYNN